MRNWSNLICKDSFQIDNDELNFYDRLTQYVEDQSIKAAHDDTARGRALGFTMAMLQRRFASSIYAVRRTIERMKAKREKILEDPEAYREEQIKKKVPDDFDDLPDEMKEEILADLENVVASIDPEALVESVEDENRGFDLISRKPHPEDSQTAIEVRFIEVKGRSHIGEIALTTNEFKTAERLKKDFWLYVVFNCASTPEIHLIRAPVKLGWKPLIKIEHYHIGAEKVLNLK